MGMETNFFVLLGFVAGNIAMAGIWAIVSSVKNARRSASERRRVSAMEELGAVVADLWKTARGIENGDGSHQEKHALATVIDRLERLMHEKASLLEVYDVKYVEAVISESRRILTGGISPQTPVLEGAGAPTPEAFDLGLLVDEARPAEAAHQEIDFLANEEAERKSQEDAQRRAQEEAQRKAQEEAQRKAREEAQRKAQEEAQRKAQEEAQRKAQEEAQRKAREEAERKAREEAERKAREDAERKAREEAERKAREEAERKAREEAERKAREEAERKAREEAERKAREEAERKAREEAERKAREEAERKAREEAERKAREEAERKAREEAERKAREDAERKAREEAQRKAREEAERKAQEEAQRRAREEAERKAQEEPEELDFGGETIAFKKADLFGGTGGDQNSGDEIDLSDLGGELEDLSPEEKAFGLDSAETISMPREDLNRLVAKKKEKEEPEKSDDQSIISGEDVVKKLDSFFGFGD